MVGNQVAPEVLEQLFGVQAVPDAYTAAQLALLPEGSNALCDRVNVLWEIIRTASDATCR